jgi:ribosomal protein S19E (S16A)
MDHMNNLADLKEQIQEDIITFLDQEGWVITSEAMRRNFSDAMRSRLCQIVVDRFKELENSLENS